MKWISVHTWKAKLQYKENWHVWFAWHPVTVKEFPDGGAKRIWLEYVLRKGCYQFDFGGGSWYWEYKEILHER